jgi:hypothetical protein
MGHKPMNQDPTMAEAKRLAVFGGHRAGKRKRGTSVTKRRPTETVRAVPMDIRDSDGRILALGTRMISNRPTRETMGEDAWNGLAPVPTSRAMPDAVPTGKTLGTVGSASIREVAVHETSRVEMDAVARFITICNEVIARPLPRTELPADYVPRTYAKPREMARDKWGRE